MQQYKQHDILVHLLYNLP